MKEWQSSAHVKWECKYHLVIVPKYRKKGYCQLKPNCTNFDQLVGL